MSSYPSITAAVADQHRRDLIAQADAYRLARAARQGSGGPSSLPRRPALTARRLTAAAAAGCTAAAVFLLAPAGPAHPSAMHVAHLYARTAASQVKW
jgi:hypothetical protein